MTVSDERLEKWLPVATLDGCTFSGYEASDKGGYRSIDRMSGNRHLKGKVLATRRNDDGYVLINLRCDSTDPDHNRVHTFTGHRVVLTTFDRPCPPGMEACHRHGPARNWFPEDVRWDTKKANHADMEDDGTAVVPESFPCRNAARCGGTVKAENRRCMPCIAEAREQAAALLLLGMPLHEVAARLGNGEKWIYQLAREAAYPGTLAEARAQRPGTWQRVTLRRYLRRAHSV